MEDKIPSSAGTPVGMTLRPGDYRCRDQKVRYPWWVRSVDKITTEVDESIMEKPGPIVMDWLSLNTRGTADHVMCRMANLNHSDVQSR